MHSVVTCPGCSRQLRLPNATIGAAARCPLCHVDFLTRATSPDRAEALPLDADPDRPRDDVPEMPRAWTQEAPGDVPHPRPVEAPPPRPSEPGPNLGPVGAVKWLLALPVGIPVLAIVFGDSIGRGEAAAAWFFVAVVTALACGFFVLMTDWSQWKRGLCGAAFVLVGYLALGCGFWFFDHGTISSREWKQFAAPHRTYTVQMPGTPTAGEWRHNKLHHGRMIRYRLDHQATGLTFEIGAEWIETTGNPADDHEAAINVIRQAHGEPSPGSLKRTAVQAESPWGSQAWEESYVSTQGRHVVARYEVSRGGRVFILAVTHAHNTDRYTPEIRIFFDSARHAL